MDVIACFVLGALAGVFIARTQHFKKKFKDLQGEYDKRCEELTNALGDVVELNSRIESFQKYNADLAERIKEYKHLMTSGCRNLKVKAYAVPNIPDLPQYWIAVEAQSTMNPELAFIVKAWTADNEEDRDFYIREAEELIETIQKF